MSVNLDPANNSLRSDNTFISVNTGPKTQNSSWFSRNILTGAETREILESARIGLIQTLFAEVFTIIPAFAYKMGVLSPEASNRSLAGICGGLVPAMGLLTYGIGSELVIKDRASAHISITCLFLGTLGGIGSIWALNNNLPPLKDILLVDTLDPLKNVMQLNALCAIGGAAFSAFIRLSAIKIPETNMNLNDLEKHLAAKMQVKNL